MTNGLTRRVDRLKALSPPPNLAAYLLINGETDTPEAAKARWYAEHPDQLDAEVGVVVMTALEP